MRSQIDSNIAKRLGNREAVAIKAIEQKKRGVKRARKLGAVAFSKLDIETRQKKSLVGWSA